MIAAMKMKFSFPAGLLICLLGFQPFHGAAAPENVDRGPTFSGTIRAKFPGENVTMKGLVIALGDRTNAFICYDTDLMRVSLAWTGDYLKFGNYLREISHPQPPEVAGKPVFGTKPGPGWAKEGSFEDPRADRQGPLPPSWAKYRGLYLHNREAVFSYTVGRTPVLELPGLERKGDDFAITRTLRVERSSEPMMVLVAEQSDATAVVHARENVATLQSAAGILAAGITGAPHGASWDTGNGRLLLRLPALKEAATFKILLWNADSADQAKASPLLNVSAKLPDLVKLTKGGPPSWVEPVVTQGALATSGGDGPYVVDTIKEPVPNPWNANTFFGGFDFFPDGRAAICTFHGDVWIVSGLDDKLDKLTWRRYATGLFQPLGLKVVDGKVYVTGRDQITRLHDLNHDGEADFYENFNNDSIVTENYHEFCLDLQTDRAGNFYYAKGSPWTPDVRTPHQGTVLKVSKDGSKLEVFATGLRAPNGAGMGPNDELTVSDNQGHWMPASKLNLVKKGGFYGMMPAAQQEISLHKGDTAYQLNPSDPQSRKKLAVAPFDGGAPIPDHYDQPICWLPMNMDNSSGGQVWATTDKWGPLRNHLLFTSYGRGTLFHVMTDEVEGVTQAGMVKFPLKFQTGLMRGRVNPKDGQVYLCGLRGWQTDGTKDGGFYRVRYTGQPVHMPLELHALKDGMEITFTGELDASSATDVANYSAEEWNYTYSGNYGSPELSVADPAVKRHDKMEIKSARLTSNKKTVLLEIPGLQPVNQMKIKMNLKAADGTAINQEIYNTIHKLGSKIIASIK
jgi:glucose/arabinose dehydrogenase